MLEPVPQGNLLRDELPSRLKEHGIQFLRDPLVLPPDPPELTLDVMQRAFDALLPQHAAEIKERADRLYAFTMVQSDEFGRPYRTTHGELVDILCHLNGFDWNRLLPRIQHTFNKGLLEKTDPVVVNIFHTYFVTKGNHIFTNQNEAWNIVLGLPRTTNTENINSLINHKLHHMDTIDRLSKFLPPEDPKDWPGVLHQTVQLVRERMIPKPDIRFSRSELKAIDMMLYEYVDGLRIQGVDARAALKPDIYGKEEWYRPFDSDPRIALASKAKVVDSHALYDPSVDVRDRYRYCLKLLLREQLQVKIRLIYTHGASPAQKVVLAMDNKKRDLDEFIFWIAKGGSPPAPSFFFADKDNGDNGAAVKNGNSGEKNGKVYTYIEDTADLPKPPDRRVRIFYTPHTKDIPGDLTPDNWESFVEKGNLIEIPVDDKKTFNETMSALFRSPYDHSNIGAHTANAIVKILSQPMDFLFSIPGTNDTGFDHLRKISVAHRRVGVYGQWTRTLDAQGTQIIFLTTHHKNERRSGAAR